MTRLNAIPARRLLGSFAALALASLAACSPLQGECDRLNQPGQTLVLSASAQGSCTSDAQVVLATSLDGQPQSCGAGCTCTLGKFIYSTAQQDSAWGSWASESCEAQIHCVLAGVAPLDGVVDVTSGQSGGIQVDGIVENSDSCSLSLSAP